MRRRISNSEQGTITEGEFVKVVILTSEGKAVPTRPVIDEEHRDFDIHLRRQLSALAVQLKSTLTLRKHGRWPRMQITFLVKPPLFTSRRFWYFFARFDVTTMAFTEPVFLVPSTFVHKHARKGRSTRRGYIVFQIKASLSPDSEDEWTPYRLTLAELGPRIVQLLETLPPLRQEVLASATPVEGAILITRRGARRPKRLRRAA